MEELVGLLLLNPGESNSQPTQTSKEKQNAQRVHCPCAVQNQENHPFQQNGQGWLPTLVAVGI